MPGTLLVRADASTEIGTGHVMRCFALAQAWQDEGGEAVFVSSEIVPSLEERIRSEGFDMVCVECEPGSIEGAEETAGLASERDAEWVAVDGYQFSADYQRVLKEAGCRLLFIDDYGHAESYCADIVLNQNLQATELMYEKREPYTRLLLGTKYVLLRREFRPYRGWKRQIPDVARKVLVTLGGGDPNNVTTEVAKALDLVDIDGMEAVVVVGSGNPHLDEIEAAAAESPHIVRVKRNVTKMAELMAWADVAASTGGSTSWELAFMGLASMLLVLADNQQDTAERLSVAQCAVLAGRPEAVTQTALSEAARSLMLNARLRARMSSAASRAVDGRGAERVLCATRRVGRAARDE